MTVQEILAIIFGTGLTLSFLCLVALVIVYAFTFGFKREKLDIDVREKVIHALNKYLYPCSWNDEHKEGK